MPYLQRASFQNNKITDTEGITHPLLEVLNLNSELSEHESERESYSSYWEIGKFQLRDDIDRESFSDNQISKASFDADALRKLSILEMRGNLLTSTAGLGLPKLQRLYLVTNTE